MKLLETMQREYAELGIAIRVLQGRLGSEAVQQVTAAKAIKAKVHAAVRRASSVHWSKRPGNKRRAAQWRANMAQGQLRRAANAKV